MREVWVQGQPVMAATVEEAIGLWLEVRSWWTDADPPASVEVTNEDGEVHVFATSIAVPYETQP